MVKSERKLAKTKSSPAVLAPPAITGAAAAAPAFLALATSKSSLKQAAVKSPKVPAFNPNGIVYIGHIPHGFYEEQLRGYLSQFGDVLHVYLSRSPNSARSRGYAFVQFKDNLVARIAAEAMHGYPLGGKVLRASLVEPSKAHPDMFLNADRKWRAINWRASIRGMQAQPKDADARKKKTKKLARRRAAADEKRRAAGLDYELPATHTQVETVAEPVAAAGLKRRRADDSSAAAAPPAKIASVAASATPAPALIKSPKLASPKPVVTESSAPAPKTAKAAASAAPVPPPRPASAKKPSGPKPAALQALMTKPAGPKPSKAPKK